MGKTLYIQISIWLFYLCSSINYPETRKWLIFLSVYLGLHILLSKPLVRKHILNKVKRVLNNYGLISRTGVYQNVHLRKQGQSNCTTTSAAKRPIIHWIHFVLSRWKQNSKLFQMCFQWCGRQSIVVESRRSMTTLWTGNISTLLCRRLCQLWNNQMYSNVCMIKSIMMTSSNESIFRVAGPFFVRGLHRSPSQRPVTRGFDVLLWSVPEYVVKWTIVRLVICDAIMLIMTLF